MRQIDMELFVLAEHISAGSEKGLDWLADLKHDALAGELNGWVDRLAGYIRGLWAAGFIGIEQLDDFDKLRAELGY